MAEKQNKTCKYLNYAEHLLILSSTITGCVSISTFDSLVCVLLGIKICTIAAGIKKYKSIIKNKKKKHVKIVLLGKKQLNTIDALISNALINSYIISHGKFVYFNK